MDIQKFFGEPPERTFPPAKAGQYRVQYRSPWLDGSADRPPDAGAATTPTALRTSAYADERLRTPPYKPRHSLPLTSIYKPLASPLF